jgi:hypothetical protein
MGMLDMNLKPDTDNKNLLTVRLFSIRFYVNDELK